MTVVTAPDDGVVQIAIALMRRDGGTQPRATIDRTTVSEYAFELKEGANFPPVVVFDDGADYWLADGFHRVEAAESISMTHIAATVKQGTVRDAVLYSVGVNATHGLRRTSADKRRAIMTLLSDEQWSQWSDREIARRCGVHHQLVGKIRISLDESSSERIYTTKHGTTTSMNTTNIGKVKQESLRNADSNETLLTSADDERALNTWEEDRIVELLAEGEQVIVKSSHTLLAGRMGVVTALPNGNAAIVELDGGERELIYRRDLEKRCSTKVSEQTHPSMKSKSLNTQVTRHEGINYQPNGGSEYYVRVSETMWKRLEEYQHSVGAATKEGAIERLFADAIAL